jgi:hypothetical protein
MKARIVITTDGQVSVFTDEGTLETCRQAIARLYQELAAQDVEVQWNGKVEQHRHDQEAVIAQVHAH